MRHSTQENVFFPVPNAYSSILSERIPLGASLVTKRWRVAGWTGSAPVNATCQRAMTPLFSRNVCQLLSWIPGVKIEVGSSNEAIGARGRGGDDACGLA